MANINVKQRLDRIRGEMEHISKHIAMYSGIPKKDAGPIGRIADEIAEMARVISHDSNETLLGGGKRK